jgi:hypothetical protein
MNMIFTRSMMRKLNITDEEVQRIFSEIKAKAGKETRELIKEIEEKIADVEYERAISEIKAK